jgi:Zn-dependent peptidase ImmA (M78 family)
MNKKLERLEPAKEAARLIAELKIKKAPVSVDKIARHIGAVIRNSPLDTEISGMVFIKDGVPVIGVNALHHPNRQRFTIAHEIGHLVLHRDYIGSHLHVDKQYPVLMRDSKASQGIDRIEIEANQFAAELLMPRALILELLDDEGVDLDDEGPIEMLALRFKVSKQAMTHRLSSLFSFA